MGTPPQKPAAPRTMTKRSFVAKRREIAVNLLRCFHPIGDNPADDRRGLSLILGALIDAQLLELERINSTGG